MKGNASVRVFRQWYDGLTKSSHTSCLPALGTIGAALVVLERLKRDFDLRIKSHTTRGGGQVKGVSGQSVAHVLENFNETRRFPSEGGRTSRGTLGNIEKMLTALRGSDLGTRRPEEREQEIRQFQEFLVDKVREYHNRQRLKIDYDPSRTTWEAVSELLAVARETGKEGPVAQYLVGAKLALRFPDIEIGNESYSTADHQLDRPGDFFVGDTAFHVTVSPMTPVYDRCHRNIQEGLRVYLLVSDRRLQAARQLAEDQLPGKVSVESIETFVSQNLEELSVFSTEGLIGGFRKLLDTYNERVDAVETDKSMMIEIPRNLAR